LQKITSYVLTTLWAPVGETKSWRKTRGNFYIRIVAAEFSQQMRELSLTKTLHSRAVGLEIKLLKGKDKKGEYIKKIQELRRLNILTVLARQV
jgi:hypothetical protein